MTDFEQENDDLFAYSDEKIASYLQSLQNKSLKELHKIQLEINEKCLDANRAYAAERTEIRWAKRSYLLLIFVGFFLIFPAIFAKTKIDELKEKKLDLKEKNDDQKGQVEAQLALINESIQAIALYSDYVSQSTKKLTDLKTVIEQLDLRLAATNNSEDREEIESQLGKHIEQRDIINLYITGLCEKTELLANALTGTLDAFDPDTIPHEFLARQRSDSLKKIQELTDACQVINHPIARNLSQYLSRQTTASLASLQAAIAADKALWNNRPLADVVWKANAIYPIIFSGQTKEQALYAYITLKRKELAQLQNVIENTDTQLQAQPNSNMQNMLDNLVQGREKLNAEISDLLMLHQDVLTGNHPELIEEIHLLAKQRSDGTHVKNLQKICSKIQHPITTAIKHFLIYRTAAAINGVKSAIKNHPTYAESRELVQLIEDVGKLDARLIDGWAKEVELPSIKVMQQYYIDNIVATRREILNSQLEELEDLSIELEGKLSKYRGNLGHKSAEALIQRITAINKEQAKVEKELLDCNIKPVLFTEESLQLLINKCKKVTRSGQTHPVAKALIEFLNYPTPSLLTKLKLSMEKENTDISKNPHLQGVLQEGQRYFPYIFREHTEKHPFLFEFLNNGPKENEGDSSKSPKQ